MNPALFANAFFWACVSGAEAFGFALLEKPEDAADWLLTWIGGGEL